MAVLIFGWETWVVVKTDQDIVTTVFEKLLGGWETRTSPETPPVESQDVPDPMRISRIDEILGDFNKGNLKIARLSQKPPNFSFPLNSLSIEHHVKDKTKKEWDRINSQYQNYLKNKNLAQLPHLADMLLKLGEPYPDTGAFYYNAGCFISMLDRHSEAMQCFERAFMVEKRNYSPPTTKFIINEIIFLIAMVVNKTFRLMGGEHDA